MQCSFSMQDLIQITVLMMREISNMMLFFHSFLRWSHHQLFKLKKKKHCKKEVKCTVKFLTLTLDGIHQRSSGKKFYFLLLSLVRTKIQKMNQQGCYTPSGQGPGVPRIRKVMIFWRQSHRESLLRSTGNAIRNFSI